MQFFVIYRYFLTVSILYSAGSGVIADNFKINELITRSAAPSAVKKVYVELFFYLALRILSVILSILNIKNIGINYLDNEVLEDDSQCAHRVKIFLFASLILSLSIFVRFLSSISEQFLKSKYVTWYAYYEIMPYYFRKSTSFLNKIDRAYLTDAILSYPEKYFDFRNTIFQIICEIFTLLGQIWAFLHRNSFFKTQENEKLSKYRMILGFCSLWVMGYFTVSMFIANLEKESKDSSLKERVFALTENMALVQLYNQENIEAKSLLNLMSQTYSNRNKVTYLASLKHLPLEWLPRIIFSLYCLYFLPEINRSCMAEIELYSQSIYLGSNLGSTLTNIINLILAIPSYDTSKYNYFKAIGARLDEYKKELVPRRGEVKIKIK